jgi:flagellum-specific ATP synthase
MTVEAPAAWSRLIDDARARVAEGAPLETRGTLTRLTGLVLEAVGIRVPVGSQCMVQMPGHAPVLAEVVGFSADRAFLMPAGDIHGLSSGASVVPAAPYIPARRLGEPARPIQRAGVLRLPMGEGLLGRVVDAQGLPLDHGGPVQDVVSEPMGRRQINAMDRDPVRESLDTGVRAINALLTVGRGQRLGLFAGSGVGKSVLLGMMARYTQADVIVVGLIGERGREVKEFVEDILGEDGRARSVVVAAPADAPPLLRMQGAAYATAVAEHFRDKGKHVLLLMDSLTRYAMAQREIALAIGEPPATKGYPPSCFANSRNWWSAAATACTGWVPSRRSIPCCRRATTSRTRSPMQRAPFWTDTSSCPVRWRRPGIFRRSISSNPRPASCTTLPRADTLIWPGAFARCTRATRRAGTWCRSART